MLSRNLSGSIRKCINLINYAIRVEKVGGVYHLILSHNKILFQHCDQLIPGVAAGNKQRLGTAPQPRDYPGHIYTAATRIMLRLVTACFFIDDHLISFGADIYRWIQGYSQDFLFVIAQINQILLKPMVRVV